MSSPQFVTQLLEELDKETPEIAFQQMNEYQWLLAWSDHTIVHLDFDPREDRLTLSTGVGCPDPSQEAAVYRSLLAYNTLWDETGGVTMGVLDDEVAQLYSICTCQLTADAFSRIVRNFVAKALVWKIRVALGDADLPPEEAYSDEPSDAEAESNALYV